MTVNAPVLPPGRACALCVERLDSLEEDAGERAEKRAVAGEDSAPRKREREHPPLNRGFAGRTCSIMFAAVAHMRLTMHEGQKPRPLHENATSRSPEEIARGRVKWRVGTRNALFRPLYLVRRLSLRVWVG